MLRPNRATASFSVMVIAPFSKRHVPRGNAVGFGSPAGERIQRRPQAGCCGGQAVDLTRKRWWQIAPFNQASALQAANALGQHTSADRGNCLPQIREAV